MSRERRRWIAIACFSIWALGPAIGIGLAVHELEHHGTEVAVVVLHGHFHEDSAGDHSHEVAPPSPTPSHLGQQDQLDLASVATGRAVSAPGRDAQLPVRPPEPTALAPPGLFGLCVLRL